ncbi:hypothetical protein [Bacteriovorax stolpii]|nr:hypothetical protein [Bacteriovorax stolpii]
MFVIPYVWLCSVVSQDKILLSYKFLSVILTAHVWFDIFLLKVLKVAPLWPEGSLVGGMGNPSSFAFACNFCLIYLLFIQNSMAQKFKFFMISSLVIGVVLSNALFMILIMGAIFCFGILFSKGLLRKLIVFSILALMCLLLIEYVILKGGFLANKLYAVLGNFGLSESEASSDSVSLRVEIFNQVLDFINQRGGGFIWGQFNNLSYYAVDSQYITYFLSFGLIGFGAFLTLLVVMLLRAVFISTQYKNFVIIALGIFILTFFNNRILDYFPIGYLFISLAALISKENSQKELV